jgi:ribosomal protein S18 acetylase RimI-like enzyme
LNETVQRLATEPGDYDRILRSLREDASFERDGLFVTPGDLDWWLNTDDDPEAKLRSIPLWLETDDMVGWCYSYKGQIDLFARPDRVSLMPEMIAWAVGSARAAGSDEVEIFANEADEPRKAFLRAAGLTRTDEHFTFRKYALDVEPPAPILPDGFRFRDMSAIDDDDLSKRVELHTVVWAPSRWTPEKHARLMTAESYSADLDLIVVAPNGDFAAYTIVWFEPAQRIGVFEPVGCHPDYRQLGLTKALMYEGLRRLRARDAEMAYVNSWHASLPANRLYEACGFTELERLHKWTKAVG